MAKFGKSGPPIVVGILVFLLGVWLGQLSGPASVAAQAESNGVDYLRYELQSSPYGQQSWYALKFDRRTGEVWILDAKKGSGDDKWKLVPTEQARP